MFAPNPWIRHPLNDQRCCVVCHGYFPHGGNPIYTNSHRMQLTPHEDAPPLEHVLDCTGGLS